MTKQNELEAGLQARDAGMAYAESGTPDEWVRAAELAVFAVARRMPEFTSEDVRDELQRMGVDEHREMRVLGPVLRRVRAVGAIDVSGMTRRYTRRSRHAGMSYLWISHIYKHEH